MDAYCITTNTTGLQWIANQLAQLATTEKVFSKLQIATCSRSILMQLALLIFHAIASLVTVWQLLTAVMIASFHYGNLKVDVFTVLLVKDLQYTRTANDSLHQKENYGSSWQRASKKKKNGYGLSTSSSSTCFDHEINIIARRKQFCNEKYKYKWSLHLTVWFEALSSCIISSTVIRVTGPKWASTVCGGSCIHSMSTLSYILAIWIFCALASCYEIVW